MPNRYTHEQIAAHDDKGERHVVRVTHSPIRGSPHLQGPRHYPWNDGQTLHLIDDKAGILEYVRTKQRLKTGAAEPPSFAKFLALVSI